MAEQIWIFCRQKLHWVEVTVTSLETFLKRPELRAGIVHKVFHLLRYRNRSDLELALGGLGGNGKKRNLPLSPSGASIGSESLIFVYLTITSVNVDSGEYSLSLEATRWTSSRTTLTSPNSYFSLNLAGEIASSIFLSCKNGRRRISVIK